MDWNAKMGIGTPVTFVLDTFVVEVQMDSIERAGRSRTTSSRIDGSKGGA